MSKRSGMVLIYRKITRASEDQHLQCMYRLCRHRWPPIIITKVIHKLLETKLLLSPTGSALGYTQSIEF